MTITIEILSKNIQIARAQEEQHRANMNAASGAAQAYEQLLTALVVTQREDAAAQPPVAKPATTKKAPKAA